MSSQLSAELILYIFELARIDDDERCEEPTSSAYWSWPLRTQEANWDQRLLCEMDAWNQSVSLRLACRTFDDLMSRRLKESAVLMAESSHVSLSPISIGNASLTRLKIFTREGCHRRWIWRLLHRNSPTIESFIVEMGAATSEHESRHPLPHLGLRSVTFPRLTTFTFRTNAASEWLHFKDLVLLLRNAAQLQHLTIFQLAGPSTERKARNLLGTQGEPACKLRSLYIRRVRWIDYENLKFIVAKSHQTLNKLTWVFERPATLLLSDQTFDRGVLSDFTVHNAFRPCTEIETLRVADMVYDPPPPTPHHATGSTAQRNSPLCLTLDEMIAGMKKLKTLEISGAIMTPMLYDLRRDDIVPLQSLFITRYPQFRLQLLMSQLRRDKGPLSQLQHLALDRELEADVEAADWQKLHQLCRTRGVILRLHG